MHNVLSVCFVVVVVVCFFVFFFFFWGGGGVSHAPVTCISLFAYLFLFHVNL